MTIDYHPSIHQHYRTKLSTIALPLQMMVDKPVRLFHWLTISFSSHEYLLTENAKLRAHNLLLQSKLQKLLELEKENAQLRELLQSSNRIGGKVLVAELLAIDLNPSLAQMVIDKGSHVNVYHGQPVLDAYGVIGQVVDVGTYTSKILLLTDSHSAIPVQDYRNGVRAIAVGQGQIEQLSLIDVPVTDDIREGDLFVSSGLAQRFPVGYPVGVVQHIEKDTGQGFAKIVLTPTAHFDRSQQVLLVWPTHLKLANDVRQMLDKPLRN